MIGSLPHPQFRRDRAKPAFTGRPVHPRDRAQRGPEALERPRGLPAFQQIAEAIAPYVTLYPKNWKVPSDGLLELPVTF
ncbi:TcmI family type II polyketide cyclase [Planosporangium flavigriseum]|nr:TcmI family type II polyketide cyclase [Planosporangium flavigriseum]